MLLVNSILVRKAIRSGLSNCVEWVNSETQRRVRSDADLRGLTTKEIKHLLVEWVSNQGGESFKGLKIGPNGWIIGNFGTSC